MAEFKYKGIDAKGQTVSGSLEALDRKQVIKKLRLQKIKPVEITAGKVAGPKRSPVKRKAAKSKRPKAKEAPKEAASGSFSQRFQTGDKVALPFFSKLLQLHSNGMALGDAVSLMSQRMSSPVLKQLSSQLYKDLSEGRTLASAMRKVPEVFDPMLVYLIEAGEATGNVLPILENVIENLQQRADLRKKIASAMAYPIFLIFVALGVVGLFLFFLLPRIETMMSSMGGEMNIVAKIMIGFSDFAVTQGPFVFIAFVVMVFGFMRWRRTEKGRVVGDRWLLRLPMLSSLFYNADICRITNVMGILLSNGINTTESLKLAENTVKNLELLEKFRGARALINDGAAFSNAFQRYELFSDMDIDILNIGENTGSVVNSFKELYRTHALELESKLKLFTGLLSGGALGFAFLMVFVLTLGIVLSILQLSQTVMAR